MTLNGSRAKQTRFADCGQKTEDAGTYVDRLTAKLPPPNPAMQLTGPWGGNFGVLATAPARGLSLSR
jgi:hypothetical protein